MPSPVEPKARVLVVDDHVEMAELLADRLAEAGYGAEVAQSGEDAVAAVRRAPPDVVVTDLRMEAVDGLDVMAVVHEIDPGIPVLIMTAFGAIESAVDAIKRGAFHYLTKPFALDEALVFVERALAERRLHSENRRLRLAEREKSGFGAMVGRSRAMQRLFGIVGRVAQSQAPVLVRGESGTGKELVARSIHDEGPRRDAPFVVASCSAMPESLLDSELFGHVKGAFTGATGPRRGLFLEADGGTLFLDEVGEMPSALQAKLLRVLEDGEVRAVGSDAVRKVDVRLIAATHRDLETMARDGLFRQDLFFRLNVVPVAVPALRDRPEDVPLLLEHFLEGARARNPYSPVERFSPEAVATLARRPWPGNVREVQNLVERLVVVGTQSVVGVSDLPVEAVPTSDPTPLVGARGALVPLRQLEAEYIAWVVAQCGGNKTRAAEILGIDVSTIHRRERAGLQ